MRSGNNNSGIEKSILLYQIVVSYSDSPVAVWCRKINNAAWMLTNSMQKQTDAPDHMSTAYDIS